MYTTRPSNTTLLETRVYVNAKIHSGILLDNDVFLGAESDSIHTGAWPLKAMRRGENKRVV